MASTPPPESDLSHEAEQQQQQQHNKDNNNKKQKGPRPNEPRGPLPDEKFSLDYAVALWTQVQNCDPVKHPEDTVWLVDALRTAAELALWGDKNNHEVADFLIMESTIVSHISDIIDTPNLDNRIYVQCIQSVVILLQNHSRESTLFFILSNGKFNRFIEAKLDYDDEEVVSHFVSFLKTVTQRLQSKNILPLFCTGGSFPLLAAAMNSALLTHDDRMVRTSVRQVIAQLLRIKDDAVQQFAQGCLPRLIDDLGAFLEAQLRTLGLYVTDENVSNSYIEMFDEDILDEGLYMIDLLAGCITDEEKTRMARTMKEYVLERLLFHAQDADSSDLVVSTIVFLFLSKWFRSSPKWFLEHLLTVGVSSTCFSSGSTIDRSTTNILIAALSWALHVPAAATAHHPASSVTRAAICCLGTLLYKITDSSVDGCCCSSSLALKYKNSSEAQQEEEKEKKDEEENDAKKVMILFSNLVKSSLEGLSKRIDRTSAFNFAVMYYIASVIFADEKDEENKEKNEILKAFFDTVTRDSELFAPEQSSLRLEILIMGSSLPASLLMSTSSSNSENQNQNVANLFPDSSLNVFIKDQWMNFHDDLRFPLKRPLKFRSPVSQQERLTHRASIIFHLKSQLSKSQKATTTTTETEAKLKSFGDRVLHPTTTNSKKQQHQVGETAVGSSPPILSGMLVNEEVSPEGVLPSVFLTIEGNVLKVIRIDYTPPAAPIVSTSSKNKQNPKDAAAATTSELKEEKSRIFHLPIVALQITQDVSRPFVLHFCTPYSCNSAPFSVSFSSRKIASKALNVLGEAATIIRDKTRKVFEEEMK